MPSRFQPVRAKRNA
uniref:Uncharacterized protein n=1 Tax=Anguilla anguilla TaxID=7936 RepID=A0A0E9VL96_ANGAN